MKIGLVVTTPPRQLGPIREAFGSIRNMGFEGIGFRSLLQLSETLDLDTLDDARSIAEELGLFLDFGLGWLNPFNAISKPEIWALGEGDYCRAIRRQLEVARHMGCTEIVGEIAGVKGPYQGRYALDRFRSDVPWVEQLRASENLLLKIRPMLADLEIRIDLENHEDLTSHELIRLIDKVGSDFLGIALDVANLTVLGEEPVLGSARLAPYVHLAHVKDIFIIPTEQGLLRQIRPAGEGVIPWASILPTLYPYDSNTHLLVEDHKGLIQIDLFDPAWRLHFPDLDEDEVSALVCLVEKSQERVRKGEIDASKPYEDVPYNNQKEQRLKSSLDYLTWIRDKYGLWDHPVKDHLGGQYENRN